MTPKLPDSETRWRCSHCGNLTRFDVVRTRTTKEFWHMALSGEPKIEEISVETETIEKVSCRWCGASDAVELVPKPENADDLSDPDGLGGTP